MTWTRGTPALHAAAACCAFDKISGAKPALFVANNFSNSATSNCRTSRPLQIKPSLDVMKINFIAFNASATASATPSELTRYVRPSPSKPSGGITGTTSCASNVCNSAVSTRSTLPVNWWSTPPMMPSGCAMMTFVLAARRSLADRPSRISCVSRFAAVSASLSVAASVMPAPSRFDAEDFCSSASNFICADAPWTSTTRMFNDRSTATSSRSVAKFSSVTIAPSIARTNVFSRNCGMYCRMPRRSVGFISTENK